MSSKRKGAKGKDASDPNVPLLKPTFSGKPAASKPTNSTWKEWEVGRRAAAPVCVMPVA